MSEFLKPSILLRKGDEGGLVVSLQSLLNQYGYNLKVDGDFGPVTEKAVKDFQAKNGLVADGIAGFHTISKLLKIEVPPPLAGSLQGVPMTDYFLPDDQYMKGVTPKTTIVLHHTAGGHNPRNVVDYFRTDNRGRVATAFVIGGTSTRNPQDVSMDGQIIRAFDEKYWGFHLFFHPSPVLNARTLECQSIAIEICNYGFVKKTEDGRFLSYVNHEIPADQVVTLAKPFRGFKHYHKYTENQIKQLKRLIEALANRYSIDVKKEYDAKWFELSKSALKGDGGLWTHTNYREDKSDCSPQPDLIDMLNSL